MIVNDVIWSGEEDVCEYVCLCAQTVVCVCACAHIPHQIEEGVILCLVERGWGAQEAWRTMNSSVCSYKHNCLHLSSDWEAPLVLIPARHPLLITSPLPNYAEQRSDGNYCFTFPLKTFQLLQNMDRTWLQPTELIRHKRNPNQCCEQQVAHLKVQCLRLLRVISGSSNTGDF